MREGRAIGVRGDFRGGGENEIVQSPVRQKPRDRDPSEHALFRHPLDRLSGVARDLDREFVEKYLVQHLDAFHRRETVGEIGRIGVIDARETAQARIAKRSEERRVGKECRL